MISLLRFNSICLVYAILFNGISVAQVSSYKQAGKDSRMSYFLPKKLITVSFTYTMKTIRESIVIKNEPDEIKNEFVTRLSIDNAVIVKQNIVSDLSQEYTIDFNGRKAADREASITYANHGLLKDINAKSESVLPDIVESVGTIAATAVRLIGVLSIPLGTSGVNEDKRVKKTKKEEITTVIPVTYTINYTGDTPVYLFNVDKLLKSIRGFTVDTTTFTAPELALSFEPLSTVKKEDVLAPTPVQSPVFGIVYRKPAPFLVAIELRRNNNIAQYTVWKQIVNFPQFGQLGIIPLDAKPRNFEATISFDSTTFELKSYSFKKKSNAKKSLQAFNRSLGSVLGAVDSVRTENRKQNEINDTKSSTATLIQKQISELTLQKQAISLQMEVDSLIKKQAKSLEEPMSSTPVTSTTAASGARRSVRIRR